MGRSWEDVVLIESGKTSGEPTVVTVNCIDKAGLGCDLLRIVLEFGLYVTCGGYEKWSIYDWYGEEGLKQHASFW